MTIRQLRFPALAAAAAIAFAGCSDEGGGQDEPAVTQSQTATGVEQPSGDGDDTSPTPAEPTDSQGGEESATAEDVDLATTRFKVSAEDALTASVDEVGSDGVVHAIELDYSRSRSAWIWSVKTLVDGTDHEVEINADTGEVVEHEQDSTDDQEQAIDLNDPMTFDEALDLAREKVDGPLREWKLEWDDGRREYQFDLGDLDDAQEVTVDVETKDVRLD